MNGRSLSCGVVLMMCPGKSSPGDMSVTACEVARYVCRLTFDLLAKAFAFSAGGL